MYPCTIPCSYRVHMVCFLSQGSLQTEWTIVVGTAFANSLFLESSRSIHWYDVQLKCCDRDLRKNGTRKNIKTPATACWVIPSVALSKRVPGGGFRKPSSSGSSQTPFGGFSFSPGIIMEYLWISLRVTALEQQLRCFATVLSALPVHWVLPMQVAGCGLGEKLANQVR